MSDAMLWNELGNIYLRIGSPEEAIAAYTKAIDSHPDSGWPYCNLGNAYFLVGDFGRALFLYRKSIQLLDTPEDQASLWNKIGDAYRSLKDIDNAMQAYKKADDLNIKESPAEQNADKKPGNLSNLRDMFNSEKIVPETVISPNAAPKIVVNKKESVESLRRVVGIQPVIEAEDRRVITKTADRLETEPPVYHKTNEALDQIGTGLPLSDHQELTFLQREAENSPLPSEKSFVVIPNTDEMTEPAQEEGLIEAVSEPMDGPAHSIHQAVTSSENITSQPNRKPDIENLEEILAKLNIYENITRVNPINDRAWDTLGKLYKSLGRYKDSISAYKKAIDIAPEKEVYYYYLGLLYSVEQLNDEAVEAFQIVLRINPDYVLAHSALAGVYHRMGLENKANHHIATALPKMNNESAYNRACFYAICGDTELAFEFLRLALMNKDTTIEWIKSDPDLDPIRTDQRYGELIIEQDQSAAGNTKENYFSSDVDSKHNRLLPILNHSLSR